MTVAMKKIVWSKKTKQALKMNSFHGQSVLSKESFHWGNTYVCGKKCAGKKKTPVKISRPKKTNPSTTTVTVPPGPPVNPPPQAVLPASLTPAASLPATLTTPTQPPAGSARVTPSPPVTTADDDFPPLADDDDTSPTTKETEAMTAFKTSIRNYLEEADPDTIE